MYARSTGGGLLLLRRRLAQLTIPTRLYHARQSWTLPILPRLVVPSNTIYPPPPPPEPTEEQKLAERAAEAQPPTLQAACQLLVDTRMQLAHPPPPPPPPGPKKYSCFIGAVENTGEPEMDVEKITEQVSNMFGDRTTMVAGFRAQLPPGYEFGVNKDQQLILAGPDAPKPAPPPQPEPPAPPKEPEGFNLDLAMVRLRSMRQL